VGTLRYDAASYDFDDRVLAHLQLLITAKLRRSEPFFLTWFLTSQQGSGRHTLWLDVGVPIHFHYFTPDMETDINRSWLAELETGSYTASGVRLTDEPTVAPD
jgi:hypothetical protein